MGVDWTRVKELTLWNYEELIAKIQQVLDYEFVQKLYDHKLGKVGKYIASLLNYREDKKYADYSKRILNTIRQVEIFGVRNISGLVSTIHDSDECEKFIEYSNVQFEDLIVLLNCILRWILPFSHPIRNFIDSENSIHLGYLTNLRKRGVRNNLDMIEECRTEMARESLAVLTEVPRDFILDLFHRTDISRLPWVRGKTVMALSSAGYDTLKKIANAFAEKMISKLEKSLAASGRKFSRSWIDPVEAIAQAKVIPIVINS